VLSRFRDEVGASAELTRLLVNDVRTQLIVRRGDGVEAYSVRSDSGELVREDATITISGGATLDDFAYPLAAVKPAAIDRMLGTAGRRSGAADFEPGVLTLERAIPFGSRRLEWTINAEGGGRYLLFRANSEGAGCATRAAKGCRSRRRPRTRSASTSASPPPATTPRRSSAASTSSERTRRPTRPR